VPIATDHMNRPRRRRRRKGARGLVDFSSGRAAYLQVVDSLRARIASGEFPPGAKLPSSRDLMGQYDVSRIVATAAMSVLKQSGEVYSHPGKGIFVRPQREITRRASSWYTRGGDDEPTSPTARQVEQEGAIASWDHTSQPGEASADVAERLGVAVGAPVMCTEYVFRADGAPIHSSTSWEPLELTRGTDVELPEDGAAIGVVARFDHIGIRIDTVDEDVAARMPTEAEQEKLAVSSGVPVFVIRRTFRAAGRAVETADIVVPADRQTLAYEGIPVT
jgi:DNA-binding GntR family transcriptional regulator